MKRGGVNRFRGRVAGAGRQSGTAPRAPGALRLAVVLLIALAGLTVLGGETLAQAQTVTTFVSNLGQQSDANPSPVNAGYTLAQQFTTGTHPLGYDLTEVVFDVAADSSGTPEFALYTTNSSDEPGTKIVDLNGSVASTGEQSLTPASPTTLSASTGYFVAFGLASGAAYRLRTTLIETDDLGAAAGWSIANDSMWRLSGSWTLSADIKIAVKGMEASEGSNFDPGFDPGRGFIMVTNLPKDPVTSLPTVTGTLAQSFRAGAEGAAFRTLSLLGDYDKPHRVSIHADNSSAVGDRLLTLANSGRTGVTRGVPIYEFTAGSRNLALKGGTRYWIVVDLVTDTALYKPGSFTADTGESGNGDPGAEGTWIIDDKHRTQSGSTWTEVSSNMALRISVQGYNSALRGPEPQPDPNAPRITGAPSLNHAGIDCTWGPGEKVEVTVEFDKAVTVTTTGGAPSIGLRLGWDEPRVASYVSGSGTTELLFEFPLVEADGENNTMLVPSNSLALNGGTVRSSAGIDAWLKHERGTRGIHEACQPGPDGPRLLVGNVEGHQMDSRLLVSSQQSAAQSFTTGGAATLHAVRVRGTNFKCTTMVSIHSDSSGAPGADLASAYKVEFISTFALATFVDLALNAGATYWVVVESPGVLSGTSRTSENGLSGWSIGDRMRTRTGSGSWGDVSSGHAMRIQIFDTTGATDTTFPVPPTAPQDLVSNLGNTDSADRSLANSANSYAQSFSTGSSWATLTAVKMVGGFARDARLSIYSDRSGAPGSCVAALQNPDDLMGTDADDGTFTFSAGAGGITLSANTKYWVLLETAGQWRRTGETNEAGTSGWSIGDRYWVKKSAGAWGESATTGTMKMAVVGAAGVLGRMDIGDSPNIYRIKMTAGKTYTFDEIYRKWAMTSEEWYGGPHFYLPDEYRLSLYTRNSSNMHQPVSSFQNRPEHGWQLLFREPGFQIHPYELTFDVEDWDDYFDVVQDLSVLFASAHLFPPGVEVLRTMCELAEGEGRAFNICGEDLDVSTYDGRQLRTASYTPTQSGVYYLQVTRVHDDGPVWGPDSGGTADKASSTVCCEIRSLSDEPYWFIPLAGYDSDFSGGADPTVDDIDENDHPTYMEMLNENSPARGGRAAMPNYEITVTVSDAASEQQAANTPATGSPGIEGSPRSGETLTATTSGIADTDGMSGAVFAYQWIRRDLATATEADIEGATASTYTVTAEDEGKALKVRVSFTDDGGNEESLTSFAVIASPSVTRGTEAANAPATGTPGIDGSPVVGQTLTATTSDIGDEDGTSTTVFAYQWLADDADIEDATASTYTLAASEQGKALKVRVTFTDDAGNEESVTSAPTATVSERHDQPSQVTATATTGAIVLTWEAPYNFDGPDYHILRHRPELGEPEPLVYVDFTESTDTTFTDTEVEPGVLYVYRVRATINFLGELGEASDAVQIRMPVEDPSTPQDPNTLATGAPTITGTAQVGETLTADTSGIADADGLTNATFSYQWLADDADIGGATASTYTLAASEQGKALKVRVSFTDDAGNDESVTSSATGAVAAAPSPLTAEASQVPSSHDGNDSFTFELRFSEEPVDDFSYRTLRDHAFTVTGGEVVNARRLNSPSNVGWEITVSPNGDAAVTVSLPVTTDCDSQGAVCTEDGRKLSNAIAITVPGPGEQQDPNSPATGAPTISGTAQVGETLTASTSGIADADGLTNATFAYQWLADDTAITNATASTYTLTSGERGKAIKVRVSFTDDAGNDESLTSAGTAAVEARPNSPATGVPTISGTAQVGETLTADLSGIADEDGLNNAAYSYQWLADDSDIAGATGSTYTLDAGDEGKRVKVRVTFTDDAGNAESLTSAATGEVEARPNGPATGQPTIGGTAQVGETLTANVSGIADADGLDNASFAYQWMAADVEIAGATGRSYTLAEADEGKTIRVKVSFTDDSGNSESLTSAATDEVAAAPVPLTVSLENAATTHDGQTPFTFELRFSEEFELSYVTLRDHAFTVTGGTVTKSRRLDRSSNVRWEITLVPDSNGDVTIVLPVATNCDDQGAICTEDGRKLSNSLNFTVSGPDG